MKRLLLILVSATLAALTLSAQGRYQITWERVCMDGSRTGCSIPGTDNIKESIGSVEGNTYHAPNGKDYKGGSIVKIASRVIDAQSEMTPVKRYIGESPRVLRAHKPESELSDMMTDRMLITARRIFSDKQIDVAFGNFGGIRTIIPKGRVIADDIISMFPFKNHLAYVKIKGTRLREIFDQLVTTGIQPFSGATLVVRDGNIESLLVGGKPIDDDAEYGITTLDFLLDGGDNLFLRKDAVEFIQSDVILLDLVMEYVDSLSAAKAPITYHTDGRVSIINSSEKEGK